MIETLSGTSAGSPTELMTMNFPRRSIFSTTEILIGGSSGTSPSPCHSPISGSNSFIALIRSALSLQGFGSMACQCQRFLQLHAASLLPASLRFVLAELCSRLSNRVPFQHASEARRRTAADPIPQGFRRAHER